MKPGKRTRKRFVAVFFLLGLMLCCASAEAAVTYYLENGALTVKQASPDVTITGTYDANTYPNTAVTVENGYQGTITLDGVSIDLDLVRTRGPMPILLAAGASPDILLSGDNRLRGGWYAAGLGVPAGAKVRISGPGSLAATGGKTFGGAGIGGIEGSGAVTITGGTVTATSAWGAGIGGGSGSNSTRGGDGGTVTITGGTVTATGGAGGVGGGGQDIGVGAGDLGGEPGTTVITGGSVNARAGKVDNPTYDKANAVAPDSEFPRTYESGSEGWTISFTVNVAPPNTYTYTFTIPQDRKAYLWLPSGKSPPTPYDVKNLTLPKLTLTPQFASGKCVVGLGVSSGTLQAWQRLDPGSVTPVPGTGTPDNNDGNGFASPGKYTYRASTGTAALSIWSDPATETLKAPAISGPASMTLTTGYAATSTDVYTITGNPTPNVTATGDPKIVWDGGTEKLKIAAGLAAGTYPVILTAVNGLTPAATFTFTLTVKTPAPGPGPDPTPPSSDTKPSNMKITIGGESEPLAQTGTTFSATVPYGTDVSSVDITGNLPPGAKSEPKLPA